MANKEKLNVINDILTKYNFKLSNTDLCLTDKENIITLFRNNNLDYMASEMSKQKNCIIEIMKVLYNVGEA